jgi:hypothetical protein
MIVKVARDNIVQGRRRISRAIHTIAKPSDNPSHNQLSQAERGALQDSANNHDGGAQEDHFPSTK